MAEERHHDGLEPTGTGQVEHTDLASKSLADALRLSFRLLSAIMVFVVVVWIATGAEQVDAGERGIRLLFGRIEGKVLEEGLRWSWPEPIGHVLIVPTGERTMAIDEFWYQESSATEMESLQNIAIRPQLRPGMDGALLTGDRALMHVKFTCNYRYGSKEDKADAEAIRRFVSNTAQPEEFVRSAVCNAAIRAAATHTVDSILTTGQEDFRHTVEGLAQRALDEMESGIRIQSVQISVARPPLAAMRAFDAVTSARQEKDTLINQAIGEANRALEGAAGGSWKVLAGELKTRDTEPGLLLQYAQAREDNDERLASELLERINQILTSYETKGVAKQIIYEAERYKDSIEQRVKARAETFRQLVDKFEDTPELMIERLWVETKEEILGAATITKIYLTPGKRTILRVNQDPEIRRHQLAEQIKARQQPGRP